jgi:hypothetical protein
VTAQNISNMTKEAGQGSGSSERMGGYAQFIYLLFCVLEIIYVSYIHLCCFICRNDFILSLLSDYNMIDLSVLILQSCCLCFYLFIFNCSASLHVYRIYIIYIIHMLYVLMIHIVMDIFDVMINYLLYVIIIILIYGIKMIQKMLIFLTIQKPNVRHFSIRGFAAVLKLYPFDGKNFLIWKAKMELWLTAMFCFHAAEGMPANLPPEDEAKFKCYVCVESKQPRKPHKAAEARSLAPLELVHSDLCEMNGILTKGGTRYFLTFIDDSTRFCYVYLLKIKDEAFNYFKAYKAKVENQLERKIKRLRSDRGGEYFSNVFDEFCVEHGIIHERTPPFSP